MGEEKETLQIQDPDNYEGDQELVYSHQSLVMKGMRRVYELGSEELHEGADVQVLINNSPVIIHKPNQRIEFINAIKILKSGMVCDFDETMKTNFKKLNGGLANARKNLLKSQVEARSRLNQLQRQKLGVDVIYPGVFNAGLPYYNQYKVLELDYFRDLFEELVLLIKRKKYYSVGDLEG